MTLRDEQGTPVPVESQARSKDKVVSRHLGSWDHSKIMRAGRHSLVLRDSTNLAARPSRTAAAWWSSACSSRTPACQKQERDALQVPACTSVIYCFVDGGLAINGMWWPGAVSNTLVALPDTLDLDGCHRFLAMLLRSEMSAWCRILSSNTAYGGFQHSSKASRSLVKSRCNRLSDRVSWYCHDVHSAVVRSEAEAGLCRQQMSCHYARQPVGNANSASSDCGAVYSVLVVHW